MSLKGYKANCEHGRQHFCQNVLVEEGAASKQNSETGQMQIRPVKLPLFLNRLINSGSVIVFTAVCEAQLKIDKKDHLILWALSSAK